MEIEIIGILCSMLTHGLIDDIMHVDDNIYSIIIEYIDIGIYNVDVNV